MDGRDDEVDAIVTDAMTGRNAGGVEREWCWQTQKKVRNTPDLMWHGTSGTALRQTQAHAHVCVCVCVCVCAGDSNRWWESLPAKGGAFASVAISMS